MDSPNKLEGFHATGHRFCWIDNDTVKICNNEGIERIVDLKNNFKEVEFNRIPLYDKLTCLSNHYYFDPPFTEV